MRISRMLNKLMALMLGSALTACANFQTIGSFAQEGNRVSGLVRQDFETLNKGCTDLIRHQDLINAAKQALKDNRAENSSAGCAAVGGALARLAGTSTVVLDQYHDALASLAKGENWSVSKELKTSISSLSKLPIGGVGGLDVGLFSAAATAFADLLTQAAREKQARVLLNSPTDWGVLLAPLRQWYVGTQAPIRPGIYGLLCETLASQWATVENDYVFFARCHDAKHCEPLLAAASVLTARDKQAQFSRCVNSNSDNNKPSPHAQGAADTIDQWIVAHETLKRDAFKTDLAQLSAALDKLSSLRDAIVDETPNK
jgi:hypothetical protein